MHFVNAPSSENVAVNNTVFPLYCSSSSPRCSFRLSFNSFFPTIELIAPPIMKPTMTRRMILWRFGCSFFRRENGHMEIV